MGGLRKFHGVLSRKALPPTHPGASGRDDIHGIRYQDLQSAGWDYVPWLIVVLCTNGDKVDAQLYQALHTTMSTAQAYDLYDMQQIHRSWSQAEIRRQEAARNG